MERPAGYMLLRRTAMGFLFLGIALVLIGLFSQQKVYTLLAPNQLAKEMGEAETAYHDATAEPESSPRLEAARDRLQKALDEVVRNRERGHAVNWWARTVGYALVILGGIFWMAFKTN